MENSTALLLELEARLYSAETINSILRAAHTIKGSAGRVGAECRQQ